MTAIHKPSNYHYRAEIYTHKDGKEFQTCVFHSHDRDGLQSLYEDLEKVKDSTTRIEIYSVRGAVETFVDLL